MPIARQRSAWRADAARIPGHAAASVASVVIDLDDARIRLREWAGYYRDRRPYQREQGRRKEIWRSPQVWESPKPRAPFDQLCAIETQRLLQQIPVANVCAICSFFG